MLLLGTPCPTVTWLAAYSASTTPAMATHSHSSWPVPPTWQESPHWMFADGTSLTVRTALILCKNKIIFVMLWLTCHCNFRSVDNGDRNPIDWSMLLSHQGTGAGISGDWNEWSAWSSCDRSCGIGTKSRIRTCNGSKCQRTQENQERVCTIRKC